MRYRPLTQNVTKNPVFIVGLNPGLKHRKDSEFEWDGGTRSSDFLHEAIGDISNVLLTNICNYQEINKKNMLNSIKHLLWNIGFYQPEKIICLGKFSYDHVRALGLNIPVYWVYHPSFIVRFNKDKDEYILKLRALILEEEE